MKFNKGLLIESSDDLRAVLTIKLGPSIIKLMKCRTLRWVGNVDRIRDIKNVHRNFRGEVSMKLSTLKTKDMRGR
jgi:hypothetical protein